MNFDFSEEQKMLQKAARDFLESRCGLAKVREVFESDAPYAKDVWEGAAEMGWTGTTIPERMGGAGFGHLELAVIAEEVGRALAPIPFSSTVYIVSEALRLAGSDEQKQKYLPRLASGVCIGALALAERPGQLGIRDLATELRDGRLYGAKVPVLDGDVADLAVVAARDGESTSLVLVELDGAGVERSALRSLDPARSQARIRFDGARAEHLGQVGQGAELLDRVQQRAAVLLAFEQLGGAQRCLDIAREFAMGRYAFGRPIASFQAIKHKLADMYASVELARSNCYYGAWALSTENAELPVAACLARISATEAFEHCARENLQIHGGVGFTWEYDCHLFLRRSRLLALQLGPPALWKDRLVSELDARTPA